MIRIAKTSELVLSEWLESGMLTIDLESEDKDAMREAGVKPSDTVYTFVLVRAGQCVPMIQAGDIGVVDTENETVYFVRKG